MVYDPEIYLPRILPLKHVRITHAVGYCYDILPQNGGKQIGIPAMAAHYGIRDDEILVFGDGPKTWTCCAMSASVLRWATVVQKPRRLQIM